MLGAAVIELELPEPQFEDLTLVNIDAVRGKGPAGAEVPAALAGRWRWTARTGSSCP